MEWLGKLCFPGNPKLVRYRKLRLLFFTVVLIVTSCTAIGLMFYLLNKPGYS
jgi:hypothetical protein